MITVHHYPNSRSNRIVWLMEELEEEYRIEPVSFPLSDAYKALNPLAQLPAIEDDDGDITMFESIAILQYITGRRLVAGDAKAASLTVGPRPDPAAYAEHLQLLHLGETDMAARISVVFRSRMAAGQGAPDNPTVQHQVEKLAERFAYLDTVLSDGREWITGDAFTIADISIAYALGQGEFTQLGLPFAEQLARYWERAQQRPAFQRMKAR